jgi:hypothetical protein
VQTAPEVRGNSAPSRGPESMFSARFSWMLRPWPGRRRSRAMHGNSPRGYGARVEFRRCVGPEDWHHYVPISGDKARRPSRYPPYGSNEPRVAASVELERLRRATWCPTPRAGFVRTRGPCAVVAARTKDAMQHSGRGTARPHVPRMCPAHYRFVSGDSDASG